MYVFLGSVAQNKLNAHTKNTLKTNSDSLKKRKSVIDIIIPWQTQKPGTWFVYYKKKEKHLVPLVIKNN